MADNIDEGLRKAMNESMHAYENGDQAFFDYLSDDVLIYGLDSSEPTVGRKVFEEKFLPSFSKSKRKVDQTFQDIRVVGGQAILSQVLQVSTDGISLPVRQTVVWEGRKGKWHMTHIHNARAGQPVSVEKMPTTAAGIRVLNERIATVATAVGVAQ
jgi:hypothetical protein